MNRVYLDNAAATPVDKRVLDVMLPFFTEKYYNPSALYEGARDAKNRLEEARATVAKSIGAKPSEIIFTAGGTESDNLAIAGVMNKHKSTKLLISAVEHDAVYEPAQKFNHVEIPVDKSGIINLEHLRKSIDDNTVLISIMLVNNEIGTIQPVSEVVKIANQIKTERSKQGIKTPLYIHTDACQAPLYLDVHVKRLGVDLMTLNGGKIHGPKQSGILFMRAGIDIKPEILGGGQEFGYRSGTENVAFAVGFAKALELAEKGRSERVKAVSQLRDYFIEKLEKNFDAGLNGSSKKRIANNVNVMFNNVDNERVLFALDDLGVDAAAGSACSASKDVSSRVLLAIGRTDQQARSSLRFSLGKDTTQKDIDFVTECLKTALKA